MSKDKKSGIELIAIERMRQIEIEGWTADHDANHDTGQLAMAAVCYASQEKIYVMRHFANNIQFVDPWPFEDKWDKRYGYGSTAEGKTDEGANYVPNPITYTEKQRIDLLIKAGALIAAEIDRLQNTHP